MSTELAQTERKRVLSLFILTNFALKTYLCSVKMLYEMPKLSLEKIFTVYEKNNISSGPGKMMYRIQFVAFVCYCWDVFIVNY